MCARCQVGLGRSLEEARRATETELEQFLERGELVVSSSDCLVSERDSLHIPPALSDPPVESMSPEGMPLRISWLASKPKAVAARGVAAAWQRRAAAFGRQAKLKRFERKEKQWVKATT
jgi:hypothetical protein